MVLVGSPKENVKGNSTLDRDPKSKESQKEREEPLERAKEKLVSLKPSETTPRELEKDSDIKRSHPKEGSEVDKNTEQWVNVQNRFWEKKRESLEKPSPKYLSHKLLSGYYKGVNNLNQKWQNKYLQKQGLTEIFGTVVMVGPIIEVDTRWGILVKIGIGNRGMDMVEGMAMGIKISREGPIEGPLLKLKNITPPQREGSPIETHDPEEWVVDREMVMGMVKIKMIKIEKSIETLNIVMKRKMRKRVILKILLNLR